MARYTCRVLRHILPIVLVNIAAFVDLSLSSDYTGYKVYRVTTSKPLQNEILQKFKDNRGYDFWNNPRFNITKVVVAPDLQEEFDDILITVGIAHSVIVEDVEKYLTKYDNQTVGGRRSIGDQNVTNERFKFDRFPLYSEIVQFMKKLVEKYNYYDARMIRIGTSLEGRPILGIQIGTSDRNPVIFFDAGIYAREWAAAVTALYLTKKILQLDELFAKKVTFYIIPYSNLDGYEYTHTTDRFWRKTRSINDGSQCRGVDANRNFDSHWAAFTLPVGIYVGPIKKLERIGKSVIK